MNCKRNSKETFVRYLKLYGLYEACGPYYLPQTTHVQKDHDTYHLFNGNSPEAIFSLRVAVDSDA